MLAGLLPTRAVGCSYVLKSKKAVCGTAATAVYDGVNTMQGRHTFPEGHIAYRLTAQSRTPQPAVGVMFLHGLCSDMTGTKSRALEQHAQQHGHSYTTFDTRGHGSSSGRFEDTHIGLWWEDAATMLHFAAAQRHILVGSSLGGWIALHLAAQYPDKVAGLLLIAPALDFTMRFWDTLSPEQQVAAAQQGQVALCSRYLQGGQARVNMSFFQEAERFLILHKLPQMKIKCPVRILQGVQDDVVPVAISHQLFADLPAQDMTITLVKDGNHRLSRPCDIARMLSIVKELQQQQV